MKMPSKNYGWMFFNLRSTWIKDLPLSATIMNFSDSRYVQKLVAVVSVHSNSDKCLGVGVGIGVGVNTTKSLVHWPYRLPFDTDPDADRIPFRAHTSLGRHHYYCEGLLARMPAPLSLWLATLAVACWLPMAQAQQPPHVGYIYPAGGQAGTTFSVEAAGQRMANADSVCFSAPGIEAVILDHEPPPTPAEAQTLRDRRKELQQQKDKTPEIFRELTTINRKLAVVEKLRQNPALGEILPLRITIAPHVPPGNYELRLRTPGGLSNPRVFQVGQAQEFYKFQPTEDDVKLRKERRPDFQPTAAPALPPVEISQPSVVNGWIPPGGVDRFRFHAWKGENLTILTSARELNPYLADAVPGWFQVVAALYDARGKELAYDDHYRFRPDPALCCRIPADGEYTLEIRDALYRGREDFVYRVAIGELPFISGIFPLGGSTGTLAKVALQGWNLEVDRLTLRSPAPGVTSLVVRSEGKASNRVPFAFDTLPEFFEREPNNTFAKADEVELPIIVNGRIHEPGDVDVFRLEGEAGQSIVAEVVARRLDSPLDSVLRLCDASGRQIAFNDDRDDKGAGLVTHHADSYLRATLPSNGTYFVQLWDAQGKGGPEYAYRLHLRGPQPDFALRSDPSGVGIRPGSSAQFSVYTLRQEGFTNDITFALQDAPPGFKLTATRVQTNQDLVKLTLAAPQVRTEEPFAIRIVGRATVSGREIVHPLVPSDDMMQAFAYHHLVPAQELKVAMLGQPSLRDMAKIATPLPIKLLPGGEAHVLVRVPVGPRIEKVEFALNTPPEGISLQSFAPKGENQELVLQADAEKVLSGQKGSLNVRVIGLRLPRFESLVATGTNQLRRVELGTLPPISFVIVGQTNAPAAAQTNQPEAAKIITALPVKLPAGGEALVLARVPADLRGGKIELSLNDPPEGIRLKSFALRGENQELVLQANADKILAGQKGSLNVEMFVLRLSPPEPGVTTTNQSRRIRLGLLPPISFVVVAQTNAPVAARTNQTESAHP